MQQHSNHRNTTTRRKEARARTQKKLMTEKFPNLKNNANSGNAEGPNKDEPRGLLQGKS